MTERAVTGPVLGLLLAAVAAAGCGGPAGGPVGSRVGGPGEASVNRDAPLIVYSGRNESLVGPLMERLSAASGLDVEVRYGGTAELAATLMEEGAATPADLFLSQDAAALGALSAAGLLRPLPADLLAAVPERFRSPGGDWVGLSGRARCLVYNPDRIAPEELPASLEALAEPRYRGRFGVAPTNGSFQAHMAVFRAVAGADRLAALLAAIADNEPRTYPKNSAIVQATVAGEIDFGLVNHYYLWRALAEEPAAPGANFFMTEGPAAGFVNLAGAGVLSGREEAVELVGLLLAEEAQRYFAEETFEFPLAAGVEAAVELPPLEGLDPAGTPFAEVSRVLEETLAAIHASGLVR